LKILIIDNYDSFTFNLVHYLEQFAEEVVVQRNDRIDLEGIAGFDKVVISPGPGLPREAGQLNAALHQLIGKVPLLGVCLGLQAIVEHFGGQLSNLQQVLHGKTSQCHIVHDDPLFERISSPFEIGHYHSWVADKKTFPNELEVLAENSLGLIMALRHKTLPIHAVQFHPESILTPSGLLMIQNWVEC
jgi:anthranilate synthase component II